jgi:hypothetical protein
LLSAYNSFYIPFDYPFSFNVIEGLNVNIEFKICGLSSYFVFFIGSASESSLTDILFFSFSELESDSSFI